MKINVRMPVSTNFVGVENEVEGTIDATAEQKKRGA